MINEKIIKQVIDKATENVPSYQVFKGIDNKDLKEGELKNDFITWKVYKKEKSETSCYGFLGANINQIIFSHSFAQSFWGNELVCEYCLEPKSKHKNRQRDGCFPDSECYRERWAFGTFRLFLLNEDARIQFLGQFLRPMTSKQADNVLKRFIKKSLSY